MKAERKIKISIFFFLILQTPFLFSKTIYVPHDFLTIKSAVSAALDGDIVEVDDGVYFERNIIISRKIIVRAKNAYATSIYGSDIYSEPIFIVRSEAEICGFILRNSYLGISQRFSHNVQWKARYLAIFNMKFAAIDINDRDNNIGDAQLENLIIDNCGTGISTNDAGELNIRNIFVSNCDTAFVGSNHISFNVESAVIWNCSRAVRESVSSAEKGATNEIKLVANVFVMDDILRNKYDGNLCALIKQYFSAPDNVKHYNKHSFELQNGLISNIIADVFLAKSDYKSARKYCESALLSGSNGRSPEISLRALQNLALISENSKDILKAVHYYKEAINKIDKIINIISLKFEQSNFFEDKMDIYESLINLLYKLHLETHNDALLGDAFSVAEKSKTISVLIALKKLRLRDREFENHDRRIRAEEIMNKISGIQRRFSFAEISAEESRLLLEQLEDVENEFQAFLFGTRNQDSSSPYFDLSVIDHSDFLKKNFISSDEALIEYFIGEKTAFAFFLSKNSFHMAKLADGRDLVLLVSNYLNFLKLESADEFLGRKGGEILYGILVRPFVKDLLPSITKIIFVPDGILSYLPFETLVQSGRSIGSEHPQEAGRNWRFLVEDFEISYAPSASCLAFLQEERQNVAAPKDLLAVACQGGRQKESILSLPKLNHVNKEIRALSRYFRKEKQTILMGEDAKEETLKKLNLMDFMIIHFATHGICDDKYWWRSGLMLDINAQGIEDGILQPFELINLGLNADLVVLSACQSGAGQFAKGIGLLGLTYAFLLAGSKSVLPSLWLIDDKATAIFMEIFYGYLVKGKRKGEALRLAKMQMLDSGYSHPRFWASFVLLGDHGKLIRTMTALARDKGFQ